MTTSQWATAMNNSTDDMKADFNDTSEAKVYIKNGPSDTDGVELAETYDNFSQQEQAEAVGLLSSNLSVKDPC